MKIVKSSCGGKKRVRTCTLSPQVNIKNKRESIQTQEDINAAYSEAKIQDLVEDLKNVIWMKVSNVATSDSFGFDEDEVNDYFFVDVTPTEIGGNHQEAVRVEVRAEVSYDGLEKLMEALNPIIESYDSYAYFEPVEPGIIEAYVSVDEVDMSVYGGSEYGNSSQSQYTNRVVLRYKNKSFTIYDNSDSINLPADADLEALRKWKAQITQQAGAYNDADEDYEWASLSNGVVSYYRRGKLVDKSYYMSPSDWDVETLGEWSESVIYDVIENLYEANRDVPDRMVYNSTDIEASSDDSIMFEGDNYEYVTNNHGYWIYRAVIDGKGVWRAMKQGSDESQFGKLSFPISYEQARVFDAISEPSSIAKLRKDLGKMLLPNASTSVHSAQDLSMYPESFEDAYTLAKNDFMNDYSSSGVEVYVVPDDFNAEDGEICLIVKGINRVGRLTQGKVYVYLDEEDPDVIYTALEETANALSIEPGSDDDIEMSTDSTDDKVFIEDIIDGLEDNGYDLNDLSSIKEGLWALFGYQGKDADDVIEDLVAGGFIDSNVLIDASDKVYSGTESYDYYLGDIVKYNGQTYVIIDDEDNLLTLRPKYRFGDNDFENPELGDSSEDVFLEPWQLAKNQKVTGASEDDEDDLPMVDQEYDSAATSINSNKLPAIYKMINLEPGKLYLDFGGGKFDNGIEYVKDKGATLVVYDPYNRSAEHNKEVLRILRENGGADAAINSNVLNVIKEPEARKNVLENIARITKPGAPIYITVYEGKGDGQEGPTKSGYQLNRKTADYLEEIQEVFPDATRKGKLIIAHNSVVSAATNTANIGAKITCSDEYDTTWIKLAQKQVLDSDGFYTDYTMYISDDGTSYIFMFGDEDIYGPDPQYADYECSDWNEASEWWNDYNGFEDDNSLNDIQSSSSTDVTASTVLDMNPEFRNNFEEAVDFFYEDYPATVELTDEVDEDYDTLYKAYVKETGSLYQQTPGIVYIDINWDSGEILQALQETAEAVGIEQYPDNIESSESVEGDAFSQLEDAYLSPSEYADPIEHEDSEELIEVELNQIITVDVDGDYEWDDDTYIWASPDGSNEEWRSEDGVYLDDKVGVVEHIDDLIIPNVPTRPGKYRVTGLAELIYDVSGIQEYRTEYGPDDYDSDIDIDHAVVSFNFRKSEVQNLKITPVRR